MLTHVKGGRSVIEDLLIYNEEFVKNKGYEPYQTSKYPDRRLAIVTCMDTRLIESCRQHLV